MTCNRLEEEEWLEAITDGHPHVDQCPDCRRTLAAYKQITAALARESTRAAPADWMERMQARLKEANLAAEPAEPRASGSSPSLSRQQDLVGDAVTGTNPSGRRRWAGWGVGGLGGATAAMAMTWALLPGSPVGFLVSTVEKGATMYRGASNAPHVGDTLRLSVSPGDAEHFSLRVYHDAGRLVLDCAGPTEPCTEGPDGGIEAAYRLTQPGVYDVYLLTSSSTIAKPMGSLEEDLEAAFQSGAKVFSKRRHHAE